ncbi:hypothetical protein E2562_039309 [Oryza meyeriana var. granulata]|uniref:Uncharacterized protein n=1 Tax=Oryza meyeriana var. granulata TaxID=110450 RepID=A0A6G1CKY6_9ORYZ|nr:hypothetical protein E2562_039309 [Oryza meyeriana var. granulata]
MTVPTGEVRIAVTPALACNHEPSENMRFGYEVYGCLSAFAFMDHGHTYYHYEATRYISSLAPAFMLASLGTSWR